MESTSKRNIINRGGIRHLKTKVLVDGGAIPTGAFQPCIHGVLCGQRSLSYFGVVILNGQTPIKHPKGVNL